MTRRRQKLHGFTLVEILLGAILFGMVSLGIYGVFSQGLRVEHRLRHSGIANQELFWAVETMVRDIQRMESYTMPDGGKEYFSGEQQSVAFIVADQNGLKEIRYEIEEPDIDRIHVILVNERSGEDRKNLTVRENRTEDRRRVLVRKTRRFPWLHETEEGFEREVLSRGITKDGLIFSYYSRGEDNTGIWKQKWDEELRPVIIRIDLTLLDQDNAAAGTIRDVFLPPGSKAEGDGYVVR